MTRMTWKARWFDRVTSDVRYAEITITEQRFYITPIDRNGQVLDNTFFVEKQSIKVSEQLGNTPYRVVIGDYGVLHIENDEQHLLAQALKPFGYRRSLLNVIIGRWYYVLLCLLMMIAVAIWVDRQGMDLMARAMLPLVPNSLDQRIGKMALPLLDKGLLAPSRVILERQQRIRERFARIMAKQDYRGKWQIQFRSMQARPDMVNAFALPDGTIVLLDGLVQIMNDDQVIAVLAHEFGHVHYRHTTQKLIRKIGFFSFAYMLWGDLSSIATSLFATVCDLHYSRANEYEADQFAKQFLRQAGISLSVWEGALRQLAPNGGGSDPSKDESEETPFLSTHPLLKERIKDAQTQ